MENPVLLGGQPAVNFSVERLRPGKAQRRLHRVEASSESDVRISYSTLTAAMTHIIFIALMAFLIDFIKRPASVCITRLARINCGLK